MVFFRLAIDEGKGQLPLWPEHRNELYYCLKERYMVGEIFVSELSFNRFHKLIKG